MKTLYWLLMMVVLSCLVAIGCAPDGVKEQRQIATACAGITAAVNAIAAGAETGKVSKADARDAAALVRLTIPFCEPKPADHLSPTDYSILLNVAEEMARRKERT